MDKQAEIFRLVPAVYVYHARAIVVLLHGEHTNRKCNRNVLWKALLFVPLGMTSDADLDISFSHRHDCDVSVLIDARMPRLHI